MKKKIRRCGTVALNDCSFPFVQKLQEEYIKSTTDSPTALLLCSQFRCSHKELRRSLKNLLEDGEDIESDHNRWEMIKIE